MHATFFALTCAPTTIARPCEPRCRHSNARQYSIVKDRLFPTRSQESRVTAGIASECDCRLLFSGYLVGLGGIEPPTSPLSGVRSSHLSYRPRRIANPDGAVRVTLVELVGIEPATS
jgi:hypothetical protein